MNEKELGNFAKWILTILPAMGWATSFLNIMGETKSSPEPLAFLAFIICSMGLAASFATNVKSIIKDDENKEQENTKEG